MLLGRITSKYKGGILFYEKLKRTKTAENLLKAFAGEGQARNRYNYYASVADKEGYKQIRDLLMKRRIMKRTCKRFYKFLLDGLVMSCRQQ